jgi:hypothetical protein
MASNDLDIPQISVVGIHDDTTSPFRDVSSPTLSAHSSGSIRWANSTVLRDNNPEEHDGLSSLGLLAPPSQGHRRKSSTATVSSIGSSITDRDTEDSSGLGLSLVRSGQPDTPSTLPSPTNTHVDAASDHPHALRHRLASSRGLYNASAIHRHLPVATPMRFRHQHSVIAFREETTQTSIAREPNSRAPLSWISNKKLT